MNFSAWSKIWIVITLCSLLGYVLYWLSATFDTLYTYILRGITLSQFLSAYFLSDVLALTIGIVLRFIGLCLVFGVVYLVWGSKAWSFARVKKKIAAAVFFEGVYFLSFLPIAIFYLGSGFLSTLFIGYILETISVFPLLTVLSLKIWRYNGSIKTKLANWISLASIGYLTHIWISNMFRWLSMVEMSGLDFLFQGSVVIGFLNSVITLSLSLIIAVAGYYYLSIKDNLKIGIKLFGAALIFLSLHFIIYIIYSVFVGASLYSIMLVENWPVAVLGLGLVMLLKTNKTLLN